MNDAHLPRLSKIPFIAADAILIITALLIAYASGGPLSPVAFFWIIVCVSLGAILACLPFYAEFRDHIRLAEYDKSQANLENARRIEACLVEIQQIQEAVSSQISQAERTASATEHFLQRVDKRMAALESWQPEAPELPQEIATTLAELQEKLNALADQAPSAPDASLGLILAKLEALAQPSAHLPHSESIQDRDLEELDSLEPDHEEEETITEEEETDVLIDQEFPVEDEELIDGEAEDGEDETEEESWDEEEDEDSEDDEESDAFEDEEEDQEESETEADGEEAEDDEDDAEEEGDIGDDEEEEQQEDEAPEKDAPTPSQPELMADLPEGSSRAKKAGRKETVLIAQLLIGIGNKPYLRGEGPGLSPDKGVPMEFLEIGKWQWVAPEGSGPITCQLYKNDEIPSDDGPITLEPGQRRTISPRFP